MKTTEIEETWYENNHVTRNPEKIDEIIMFQTRIFTDIFKLLSIAINKRITNGKIGEMINNFINIESTVKNDFNKSDSNSIDLMKKDSVSRSIDTPRSRHT